MLAQALTMTAAALAVSAPAPQTPGLRNLGPPTPTPQVAPPPPTVADPLRGLDLWRGAKVGMGMSDLRRTFPTANAPVRPAILTGGQIDALQLGPIDLYGHPATAHFYFLGSELSSVELTVSDFHAGRTTQNIKAAQSIAADYSALYGQGYDCGTRSLGDVDVYECKWLKGALSIQLWYMDVAGQAPLFYIAYKQADNPSYNL